jgi:hypothetical protein
MQLIEFPLQRLEKKIHETPDFLRRASPVLAAECKQRQAGDAAPGGDFDRSAN